MADDGSVASGGSAPPPAPPPRPEKKPSVPLAQVLREVFVGKPRTPKEIERDNIIMKQRLYEMFEINENFKFVFGPEKPQKWSECLEIKNVTKRRIWMEPNFIFDEIRAYKTDEIFHDISKYCLLWQPPDSTFKVCVPLDSAPLQEEALRSYAAMLPPSKAITIFHFMTIDSTMEMFLPNVHPASLVRFIQKNEVLQKLCDLFLEGKIPISDLNNVMECDFETWKITLYNYLPGDWQPYHKYLSKERIKVLNETPESRYLGEEITIEEYGDLKNPERARIKNLENATYPLPYDSSVCIICQAEKQGIIKCQNCDNMICTLCVKRIFLDEETKRRCISPYASTLLYAPWGISFSFSGNLARACLFAQYSFMWRHSSIYRITS